MLPVCRPAMRGSTATATGWPAAWAKPSALWSLF